MQNYYDIPRCSNSELSRIKRELLGLQYQPASEATLYFGGMFHKALLEPHKYSINDVDTKSAALINAMINEGRKQFMINLFCHHPLTTFEKEYFFDFEGVPFKMKADAILGDWGVDPKTTACKTTEDFIETFDDYGYWRQAAIYMIGANLKRFTFWGFRKSESNPKVFIVNAHEYPKKLNEALDEAKLLTLHYAQRKLKEKQQ